MAAANKAQIQITPVTLSEKVQPVLRNRIRSLPSDDFDLVFLSPFSHRYLPEYEVLLTINSLFWTRSRIAEHLRQMLHEISLTVETLVSHFPCKTYIHNTAGTIHFFWLWSDLAKN